MHMHIGRGWPGDTAIEDGCPCAQAPCGLAISPSATPCPEHSTDARRTMRQRHRAEECPGPARPRRSASDVYTYTDDGGNCLSLDNYLATHSPDPDHSTWVLLPRGAEALAMARALLDHTGHAAVRLTEPGDEVPAGQETAATSLLALATTAARWQAARRADIADDHAARPRTTSAAPDVAAEDCVEPGDEVPSLCELADAVDELHTETDDRLQVVETAIRTLATTRTVDALTARVEALARRVDDLETTATTTPGEDPTR